MSQSAVSAWSSFANKNLKASLLSYPSFIMHHLTDRTPISPSRFLRKLLKLLINLKLSLTPFLELPRLELQTSEPMTDSVSRSVSMVPLWRRSAGGYLARTLELTRTGRRCSFVARCVDHGPIRYPLVGYLEHVYRTRRQGPSECQDCSIGVGLGSSCVSHLTRLVVEFVTDNQAQERYSC